MSVKAYRYGRVPEDLIYSAASDRACRLHAVLTRWADTKPGQHPTREELGGFLRCSVDSVDRAVKELVDGGFLEVVPQYADDGRKVRAANDYVLVEGGRTVAAGGSRKAAATKTSTNAKAAGNGGRRAAAGGGRTGAAAIEEVDRTQSKNEGPPAAAPAEDKRTNALLSQYIDSLPETPPKRERGHLARVIKEMLDEGVPSGTVWITLDQDYRHRDVGPSYLPNLVAARQRGATRSTGRGPSPAQQKSEREWKLELTRIKGERRDAEKAALRARRPA